MTITREDLRFWDVRTAERRIRRGELSQRELEKHVKALPDVAEKAAPADSEEYDE